MTFCSKYKSCYRERIQCIDNVVPNKEKGMIHYEGGYFWEMKPNRGTDTAYITPYCMII